MKLSEKDTDCRRKSMIIGGIGRRTHIKLVGKNIEQVSNFKCLANCVVSEDYVLFKRD